MIPYGNSNESCMLDILDPTLPNSPSKAQYEKCRLLYLVGQLQPGGMERQLCYLLQGMNRESYQPAVVVWNFSKNDVYAIELRRLGVPIYSFSKGSTRGAKLKALRNLLRRLNPEVLHSYTFFTNFAAQWAARGTGTIPIGSVRSDFFWAKRECGPLLGRLSARWPCAQIFNSHSAAKNAQGAKGIFVPKRIFVVGNGLDMKRFVGTAEPIPAAANILGVGSLYAVKRWDRLLMAVAEIKQRSVEFKLQIAGEGPLRQELQQQMEGLDLSDRVRFPGHNQDIFTLMNDARLLVHTADSEGCPNVIMEAMACGRPVVAMDAGDISFLVDDGKTGFVISQGDHDSLVNRIIELLQNHSLCNQMGAAAREKAAREFGLERLVEKTMRAYQGAGWDGTIHN